MIVCIDLNCDMGESPDGSVDTAIMPFVSSANIACGFHAGNADTMRRTVQLALQHSVAIGAHPSFADRENFGRREMHLSAVEIISMVIAQLQTLKAIAVAEGSRLHHVKPHGALYNMAAKDASLARSIANAVLDFDGSLIVYGLSGGCLVSEAKAIGLRTASEVFSDRSYQPDGTLTRRTDPSAMIHDKQKSIEQVLQMVRTGKVVANDGTVITVTAETVCIHGDETGAAALACELSAAIRQAGITILPPS